LTWEELVTDVDGQFVFPGAGVPGATLLLQFYLASGGTLVNEAGQPALQAEPLVKALSEFSMAQSDGFLVSADSSIITVDEAWQLFQGDSLLLVLTTAGQFLTIRSAEFEPAFAPIPGVDGPLTPLLDGWAWAISTTDPTRRALALELMTLLIANDNLGEWSYASHILPAHRGAFDYWIVNDRYSQFMQLELERADPFPRSVDSDVLLVFQSALLNVISLGMLPQTAADQAILALQP
jgi:ABC-type glycerol-3-phosphate transport system substrate-binding protein